MRTYSIEWLSKTIYDPFRGDFLQGSKNVSFISQPETAKNIHWRFDCNTVAFLSAYEFKLKYKTATDS